jgi:uncharacterized membrane protein YkvA (DUF1232 family)
MLMAFKQQLKHLAKNREEFMEHIQSRVGHKKAGDFVEPLRNLAVVMPEMIAQVQSWSNDTRIPSKEKKLHGFMLTYLYHPVDFLPESGRGLFGYLDDAYLVGSIYSRTMRLMDFDTRKTLPNLGPLATSVDDWLKAAREVLPSECQKIDSLLEELVQGRLDAFDRLMSQNEAAMRGS